jgi:hypothetical protein
LASLTNATPQFLNGFLEANTLEELGNLGAKPFARAPFVLHRVAQNVTDLLLHGMAVSSRSFA